MRGQSAAMMRRNSGMGRLRLVAPAGDPCGGAPTVAPVAPNIYEGGTVGELGEGDESGPRGWDL